MTNASVCERVAAGLLSHPQLLLMLDYDGTLVPLKDRPDLAVPGLEVLWLLHRLTKAPRFRIAVVSGRELADLQRLLPAPSLILAGCHGAELWDPGESDVVKPDRAKEPNRDGCLIPDPEGLRTALHQAAQIAADCTGDQPGFLLEQKKYAFSLHYRLAAPKAAEAVLAEFRKKIKPLLTASGLVLTEGKMVLEVGSAQTDKGKVVQELLRRNPGHYPVYFGDDTTDEDAFRVIHGKGAGVLVAEKDRVTMAGLRLHSPVQVLELLQILAARC